MDSPCFCLTIVHAILLIKSGDSKIDYAGYARSSELSGYMGGRDTSVRVNVGYRGSMCMGRS